ncbi:GDYXXLXY domain-containing protein [Adhaeribacter swui]|uniref:GDYXXLXY domain-containing protein n=1 Tax=Adhaeribacter swui TaxID=2086471 RepID=A0A7G7G4J2_9BACT|nr:GDYXXLXY domain-containing protein [Adhaeribacter swui]QNF32076.1 GDYXXLXY domain-containing protein [Adhaeribacter swui]
MNSKKLLISTFMLVALVQVYVPAKMILDQEKVLATGKEFKFKTAPVDPYDPFRGKYITLNFAGNTVKILKNENWLPGETAYVSVITDQAGFASIKAISKKEPATTEAYFKTTVRYVTEDKPQQAVIDFPFDRYYMEESKAADAEKLYQQLQNDTTQITYALVSIKNGSAVLKDVLVGETPIRELVKANPKK